MQQVLANDWDLQNLCLHLSVSLVWRSHNGAYHPSFVLPYTNHAIHIEPTWVVSLTTKYIRPNDHVVETILLCRLVGFYVSEEWQVNILTLNLIWPCGYWHDIMAYYVNAKLSQQRFGPCHESWTHQDESNDAPQPICESLLLRYNPLLRIRINVNKPQARATQEAN